MSTSPDFVAYVCEQIEGIGNVRSRKMFGEYMIYINEKPILLVCDNTVFVKMLPSLSACFPMHRPVTRTMAQNCIISWILMTLCFAVT